MKKVPIIKINTNNVIKNWNKSLVTKKKGKWIVKQDADDILQWIYRILDEDNKIYDKIIVTIVKGMDNDWLLGATDVMGETFRYRTKEEAINKARAFMKKYKKEYEI